MYEMLIISFAIALIAYTYSIILTSGGMLLDWWYIYLQNKIKNEKIFNVLVNCPKCVAGQWSLWIFFFTPYFDGFKSIHLHILFICLTIWISIILNKFYLWLTN